MLCKIQFISLEGVKKFSYLQNRHKPLKLTGFPLLSEVSMQTSDQKICPRPYLLTILLIVRGCGEVLPHLLLMGL